MTSTVDIANYALNSLGASNITALDENSKPARIVNQRYEAVRDSVFRSHPWNCLIRRAELAQESTAPTYGYGKQYALPTDPYCLRVLEFSNGSLKDTSKQALSYANSLDDNVYGISDSNIDIDNLESLGSFGLSTYLKFSGSFAEQNFLNSIKISIKEYKINFIVFPKSNHFLKVSSTLSIELNHHNYF